jgi:hypothetical protein
MISTVKKDLKKALAAWKEWIFLTSLVWEEVAEENNLALKRENLSVIKSKSL